MQGIDPAMAAAAAAATARYNQQQQQQQQQLPTSSVSQQQQLQQVQQQAAAAAAAQQQQQQQQLAISQQALQSMQYGGVDPLSGILTNGSRVRGGPLPACARGGTTAPVQGPCCCAHGAHSHRGAGAQGNTPYGTPYGSLGSLSAASTPRHLLSGYSPLAARGSGQLASSFQSTPARSHCLAGSLQVTAAMPCWLHQRHGALKPHCA